MITLFVTGAGILLVSLSLPPGEVSLTVYLIFCFSRLLELFYISATLLSLPAVFASASGFIWAFGKILLGMSFYNLLPSMFAKCAYRTGTPVGAVLCGPFLGYMLCVTSCYASRSRERINVHCLLLAFTSYIGQCVGNVLLKVKYPKLAGSNFRSHFGIAGTV